MKKITTVVALSLLCLTAFSQKAEPKADSLTQETKFLNLETIDRVMGTKKAQISVADWEVFYTILNKFLLPDAIKEWESKQKGGKK